MSELPRRTARSGGLLTMLSLVLLCACGACAKVRESTYTLPNGLKVDLVASPRGDRAAVLLGFEVGLDHDPPGRAGMSHLLSRVLLTAATPGKPARTHDELRQRYGSRWRVEAGSDYTAVSVEVPAARLDEELDDLAARMSGLEVGEADLDRERPGLLEEMARRRGGDPVLAAMTFAAEAIRPSRGGWRGGVPREIEDVGADEIEAFFRAHFKPATARLVVVGDVEPARVRAKIESAFGKIPPGAVPVRRPPAQSRVTGTLVMGDAPSAVALAVSAPHPAEPLFPAFLVLGRRLGTGAQGRDWKVRYEPLVDPEVLLVTGSPRPEERPEDAAGRIRKEVGALLSAAPAQGEAPATVAAFGVALGTAPLKPDACERDPMGVAFARARAAQLGIDGRSLARSIEAVTPGQLADAARLFEPRLTAAVVAGGNIPPP